MSVTLDLMRHGEPVGGRKYRGQIDDPLSEKGWAQMRAAVSIAGRHNLPLAFDSRLQEVGFGVWEGKTAVEIEEETPGTLARFKADPVHARPEGAEPLAAFQARVAAGLETVVATSQDQHVLVVGHAGVVRMALAWALHIPLQYAYRIEVASASLTRLRFSKGHASLIFHGGSLPGQ
ncbi:MAG: histidine phosphatase family protein [Hydrogenophilales bacterium 17-61-76]|nr:MAG: histidine phosphatase family protein [Hydrogenophilales bacterium 17-61-76]